MSEQDRRRHSREIDTTHDAIHHPSYGTSLGAAEALTDTVAPVTPMPLAVVGRADDPAEIAADRMADSVLSRLRQPAEPVAATAEVSRSTEPSPAGAIGAAGGLMDPATADLISSSQGRPLPAQTRGRMESAFGRSFDSVRIHDGAHAAAASRTLSARAFTRGHDIYFARGQFDPASAAGEHVLAHELAHVVQGGGQVTHRLFGFGKKSDPATDLAKQKAAQDKRDKKEQEKKDKAEKAAKQKQEKAEAKQRAREAKEFASTSKKKQKAEGKRLAGERARGTAKRSEMQQGIVGDQQGDSVTSSKMNNLNERFAAALTAEQNLYDTLVEAKGEEAARDIAYRTVWLETSDEELRAVRPPRETAAERLTRAVRSARTAGNVRNSVLDDTQRGTMLSKSVELIYETFVVEVDRLMGPPDNLSLVDAEQQATATVWDLEANKAAKKKRPTPGSPVDERAKKEARVRQHLNPTPPAKSEGLDKAMGTVDDVNTYAGYGAKGTGGVSKIVGMAGKDKTKQLQEGMTSPDGSSGGFEEKIPGGVGNFAKSVNQAQWRVNNGVKDDEPEKVLPKSVETQAAEGMNHSTNILLDLLSGVQNLMRFAKTVQSAHTDRSPHNVMKATKAGADALAVVAKTGKDAADLAKFIDPGVTSAVGSVIPGFNIFISVMSIISNAMTMGSQALRVHETDNALFSARSKDIGGSSAPDVMVYPLLRVLQTYTKSLEQAVWSTAVAIANLATSIATVASGGGYGIPAAVQAGVKVVDLLHSVGHFIAGEVLVAITKNAQKDALLSLEGAAENQLMKDPTMAVDGIIFSAVKGDPAAEMFLANYRLDGKPINRAVLDLLKADPANVGNEHVFLQIRSSVMAEMGEDEDPQYFYQKWFKKAGALFASVKANTYDKWNSTGEMAKDRNELDGAAPGKGKRGAGWRIKMMFKGNKKFARSVKKTQTNIESVRPSTRPDPTVEDNSTMGYETIGEFVKTIEVSCGSAHLAVGATPQQQTIFASIVDGMPDNVLLAASRDPNNSPEWQQFFLDLLSDRALVAAGA